MSESLSAQSQSDIFCFLCGEVCSQDLFLEHINECQNKSENYVEYPINFYSIITKLSLKESIDYELKSYNYDAKKQFGINRKNTMATSDNESPSQLSWSNNSNVDHVYKEIFVNNVEDAPELMKVERKYRGIPKYSYPISYYIVLAIPTVG